MAVNSKSQSRCLFMYKTSEMLPISPMHKYLWKLGLILNQTCTLNKKIYSTS